MENLSGPIIVQESETHFLVGIHYNDRHLAREINGRAWDGEKRRWVWRRDRKNYENLKEAFKAIAKQFDISDRNLIGEKNREDKEVTDSNDIQTEDNYSRQILIIIDNNSPANSSPIQTAVYSSHSRKSEKRSLRANFS